MCGKRFSKEELSKGFVAPKRSFEIILWVETVGDEKLLIKENIESQHCAVFDDNTLHFYDLDREGDRIDLAVAKNWCFWKEIENE